MRKEGTYTRSVGDSAQNALYVILYILDWWVVSINPVVSITWSNEIETIQ